MSTIVPVILCGGSGTRLWPRSRKSKPKPFLPLIGETTLFAATALRCSRDAGFADPVVVAGAAHVRLVEGQLPSASAGSIIVEPEAKNTAAAIALAAARLPADAIMLVCPSDPLHRRCRGISRGGAYRCRKWRQTTGWFHSGSSRQRPKPGFGYLKRGDPIGTTGGYQVERFVEKPDLARAKAFLADGGFSWNGGIFAFRAGAFMDELARHRPDIAQAVRASVTQGHEDGDRFHPDAAVFATIQGESVDYAVMEKTSRAAMVPVAMEWSDIGNWQALHEALPRDPHGNAVRGEAELKNCRNVLVDSDGPHVSVVGVDNLIIVVDGNNIMITTPDGAQLVGKLHGAVNQ